MFKGCLGRVVNLFIIKIIIDIVFRIVDGDAAA